jgi:hypothetical protein
METRAFESVARTSFIDRAQIAGLASVGAGAIHLAAAGIHAEHPTVARIFVLMGAVQVVAGLVLALSARRTAAAAVVLVGVAAVGGWILTRTSGISWIDGLAEAESPQFADTVCAALGAVGLALGAVVVAYGGRAAPRIGLAAPGALIGIVSVAAMLTGATHVHSHDHATADASAADGAGHAHDEAPDDGGAAPSATEHDHGTAPAPAAFDPAAAVDLSGTPGVTPEQQTFAETLVAATLADLPQWADPAVAEAAGFHSIGDAGTGHEHYIQWDWIDDDVALDPNHPESLVYEPQPDGSKQLVSAMYMLPTTTALEDVPDLGGPLMQWHVHDNLCYTDDPVAPQVRGLTSADGTCRAPLVKHAEAPMIHVWITPNECGPFASLEGVGAGSIVEGAERLCDHAHGG